ncbi:MAG: transcription-repair-coupling factor, partial [Actinomycetota bacterium]
MTTLASLPPRLRDDPALRSLIGAVDGTIAVPDTARAVALAALAQLSGRRPLVVVCPTGTMAEQLYDD